MKPRWSSDGRELYYQDGDAIWRVDVMRDDRVAPGTPRKFHEADGIQHYDVLPDGDIITAQRPPGGGLHTELELVLNWFTELERRAPTSANR